MMENPEETEWTGEGTRRWRPSPRDGLSGDGAAGSMVIHFSGERRQRSSACGRRATLHTRTEWSTQAGPAFFRWPRDRSGPSSSAFAARFATLPRNADCGPYRI